MQRSMAEIIRDDRRNKIISLASGMSSLSLTGRDFANIHFIVAKIKKALDPNNVANPTRFINMEKMEK